METGGAPIFADDILRIQENSSADSLNFYEASRRLLPQLLTWDGAANTKQFENGLILAGCEYDNTDVANPVVSEGYILSGGEVCYFPGGTYATGATPGLLYLFKGAISGTNRVFNDGGNKEILVDYSTVVEVGSVTGNGLELQAGTAITATDEVIVLQIGVANTFKGEDYFTLRAALNIPEFGIRLTEPTFVGATLSPNISIGSALPYFVSKVNNDGTTEIRGSLIVAPAAQTAGTITVATLGAFNINSGATIEVFAGNDAVGVNLFGAVLLNEPSGGWSGSNYEIQINAVILGSTTLPTTYSYSNDFLNIT